MPGNDQAGSQQEAVLPVIDSVHNYEKIHRIGEGTYGVVYKARDVRTGEVVALKKVRFDVSRDGVPVTSMREMRILQSCRHSNIVQLKTVVTGSKPDSVFLVFEYCHHDLARLMDIMPKSFSESEVKGLMLQLLEAVAYLHSRWVVHRDLKLSNLLYTSHGTLKLCDFGLARHFSHRPEPMTPTVVTLWYRAPEILLGCDSYGPAVDMWAAGCIMAELLRTQPLFPAQGELDCLAMMCKTLGAPTPKIWPALAELLSRSGMRLIEQPYNYLRRHFPDLSDQGIDLLNGMLTYDPDRRITAAAALQHPYFREKPYPRKPHDMPTFPSSHEPESQQGGRQGHRGRRGDRVGPAGGGRGNMDDRYAAMFDAEGGTGRRSSGVKRGHEQLR